MMVFTYPSFPVHTHTRTVDWAYGQDYEITYERRSRRCRLPDRDDCYFVQ